MKKYQYIIFDIDNTLLDFSRSEYYALQKVFATYGVVFNENTFNQYKEINHDLWEQLEDGKISKDVVLKERFKRFFLANNIVVDGVLVDKQYRGFLEERNDVINGAMSLLTQLKSQGYTIFAGTNGVGQTQRKRLASANMTDLFDELYISEEVGFEKPDVRFFDYIFNDARIIDLSTAVMIGDSLSSDIEGAKRVGIDSIWLSNGAETTDKIYTKKVDNLSEILALV
ncbi:YjjG family noncanonical pyrimidine nucleotidase [Vagococcus bubulae]|uniref:Noncanonical pyrimidine nucleotidase, YjjG family n=1 Tax=Vagococcus bubulae TaxID=1977868 RepID=A0A429ZMU8_9ENTE|nr:YjjG family noncanonical pyrimidine nucleotidase [Vagococcus bubulae]RST95040.1 noncanonical pyrimidine nucleotidase, YjjG family [Vagococcus bubulae]